MEVIQVFLRIGGQVFFLALNPERNARNKT